MLLKFGNAYLTKVKWYKQRLDNKTISLHDNILHNWLQESLTSQKKKQTMLKFLITGFVKVIPHRSQQNKAYQPKNKFNQTKVICNRRLHTKDILV